ncbi:MAG: hypothetical protein L6R40_000681 [Gallowayella cf. fulva]|nr:MAG: hypothetical protein L6R40_000681 [Xanthomendoza cf. fulva]
MSTYPPIAKALLFDIPTKTLNIHPTNRVPAPDPARDDHLIHVKAIAPCTNELDWVFLFPDALLSENPEKQIIPCYDVAGTVITAPPASPFQPGDDIYARTYPSRPGNYREYTIGRTSEMALIPQTTSWVEAASVPMSAVTAWQALFEHAGLHALDSPDSKGKRVLVTAAAGGCGVWLVQLASIAGLAVIAQIGNKENDKLIRELGASETINYRTTSLKEWAETNEPVDIVVDCKGATTLEEAWYCVKDQGSLISIVEPPEERRPKELKAKELKNEFFIMYPSGQQLGEISKLIEGGRCRAVVDSVWAFEEFEAAFAKLNGGHARGKIVIRVADEST